MKPCELCSVFTSSSSGYTSWPSSSRKPPSRFRQCITVTTARGERRPAAEWVPTSGRAVRLKAARVTDDEAPVGAVVLVKKKGMKEPWCLATSLCALALLTLLGEAGERLGMARHLKAKTVKNCSYSLFHQGCFYYHRLCP